jgi:hypothetical protein
VASRSNQESSIEFLAQYSCGAPFFFLPEDYRKGKSGKREPADLAWVDDELVVLFYLTESAEDIEKQIQHNLRQARGYRRLWRSRDTRYVLRGKNRFGDKCEVAFSDVAHHLTILIVSCNCSVIALPGVFSEGPTIVVSNAVMILLARGNATLVDMLTYFGKVLRNPDSRQFMRDDPKSSDFAIAVFQEYLAEQRIIANVDQTMSSEDRLEHRRTFDELMLLRVPTHSPPMTQIYTKFASSHNAVSRLFGDFRLSDSAILTHAVVKALREAEAPSFTRWAISAVLSGVHYPFAIVAARFSTEVELRLVVRAFQRLEGPDGIVHGFVLAFFSEGENYRTPTMSWIRQLPAERQVIQALGLLAEIAEIRADPMVGVSSGDTPP